MAGHAVHLPYLVRVDGETLARFAVERDARGFARARYGADAAVVSRVESHRDRIIAALRDGIDNAPDIADATAIDRRNVQTIFTRLRREGLIRRVRVSKSYPYRAYYEVVPCA